MGLAARLPRLAAMFAASAFVAAAGAEGGGVPANLQPHDGEVALLLLYRASCAAMFPELAAKTAPRYEDWRKRNAAAVARIEGNPEWRSQFQRKLDEGRVQREQSLATPALRAQSQQQCDDLLTDAFAPPTTIVPASPRECWDGFMRALAAGDGEQVAAYFTADARGRYRKIWTDLGPEGMRKAAAGFGELKKESRMGEDLAFGFLARKRPDGEIQAFEISFMRDQRSGGWYIASM